MYKQGRKVVRELAEHRSDLALWVGGREEVFALGTERRYYRQASRAQPVAAIASVHAVGMAKDENRIVSSEARTADEVE